LYGSYIRFAEETLELEGLHRNNCKIYS